MSSRNVLPPPAANDGIAGHSGCELAELFTGKDSSYTDVYPLGSFKDMPGALQDFIRDHGAPHTLMSDNAKANISQEMVKVLRFYNIKGQTSTPKQQNQNPAERRIQDIKHMTDSIMDCTHAPAPYWLLCTLFVCSLYNVLSLHKLGGKSPEQMLTNQVPDISPFLAYRWWEPVYYHEPDSKFPSETRERLGRWIGPAKDCGDIMTFNILDAQTGLLVKKSVLCPALDNQNINLRAELDLLASLDGESTAVTE